MVGPYNLQTHIFERRGIVSWCKHFVSCLQQIESGAPHLAELLQYERAANHRLYYWLALKDPLPLIGHIPVFWMHGCILYYGQLAHTEHT